MFISMIMKLHVLSLNTIFKLVLLVHNDEYL